MRVHIIHTGSYHRTMPAQNNNMTKGFFVVSAKLDHTLKNLSQLQLQQKYWTVQIKLFLNEHCILAQTKEHELLVGSGMHLNSCPSRQQNEDWRQDFQKSLLQSHLIYRETFYAPKYHYCVCWKMENPWMFKISRDSYILEMQIISVLYTIFLYLYCLYWIQCLILDITL